MKKILFVFGTRPEAIKLAPIILQLKENINFQCYVCVTGQHREMLHQVLELFEIEPDIDLNLMQDNQSLASFTSKAIEHIDTYIKRLMPDFVLIQGDTATVLAASIACYFNKTLIGHVEAGLRTHNLYSPWPEEGNRQLVSQISKYHFVPTEKNKQNLLHENIIEENIFITGNTIVDSLLFTLQKVNKNPPVIKEIEHLLQKKSINPKIILITCHRRENFGEGFESIFNAIKELATEFKEINFVYPVHLNPNVTGPVDRILKHSNLNNIFLIRPLDYLPFVYLMSRSFIILTDSGGIQEEAPTLHVPVLILRETTERQEAIDAGTSKLIGINKLNIINEVRQLIVNRDKYQKMIGEINPFGNGNASEKIITILEEKLLN